jgi:hypothetical protein
MSADGSVLQLSLLSDEKNAVLQLQQAQEKYHLRRYGIGYYQIVAQL